MEKKVELKLVLSGDIGDGLPDHIGDGLPDHIAVGGVINFSEVMKHPKPNLSEMGQALGIMLADAYGKVTGK